MFDSKRRVLREMTVVALVCTCTQIRQWFLPFFLLLYLPCLLLLSYALH